MAYKTILVHLNDPRRAKRLLDAAVPLARSMGAHLVGLSVMPPFVVIPGMDGGGASVTVDEHRMAYIEEAKEMKAIFNEATSDLPRPAEWRDEDAGFGSIASMVIDAARSVDLVVASQPDPAWLNSSLREDPVRLAIEGGRPTLLVPNEGKTNLPARRALVAWNGTREAARAVFDAIPLLKDTQDVGVVWINPEKSGGQAGDLPAADICAALSRHGMKCQGIEAHALGGDAGHELLRQATAFGADILVMGCYGHSRLREFVLGGASRDVLSRMTLPVLMSH